MVSFIVQHKRYDAHATTICSVIPGSWHWPALVVVLVLSISSSLLGLQLGRSRPRMRSVPAGIVREVSKTVQPRNMCPVAPARHKVGSEMALNPH
jgi:hypothetical protein